MKPSRIYLDHSATTPVREEAVAAMRPLMDDVFGNPSSLHSFGQDARAVLESSRETIAGLINAGGPDEIIFTAGGTESDNLALSGVMAARPGAGAHLIVSAVEHHAVLYTARHLAQRGSSLSFIPVDRHGILRVDDAVKALRPETLLISVMHANNETGVIQPVAEIAAVLAGLNKARERDGLPRVYLHVDAVQTAGKLPLDVQALGVDLLSVSAHKFYGPRGAGFLWVRPGVKIEPVTFGGHHEHNLRAGTENTAAVAGMARALACAVSEMPAEQSRVKILRDRLESGICARIPSVSVNGHPDKRMAGLLNLSFSAIEGESLLLALDLEGIAVSTGSACASGASEPSHVLGAMGLDPALAQGTVRFSIGRMNDDAQIDRVLDVLPGIVERLRAMSPLPR